MNKSLTNPNIIEDVTELRGISWQYHGEFFVFFKYFFQQDYVWEFLNKIGEQLQNPVVYHLHPFSYLFVPFWGDVYPIFEHTQSNIPILSNICLGVFKYLPSGKRVYSFFELENHHL